MNFARPVSPHVHVRTNLYRLSSLRDMRSKGFVKAPEGLAKKHTHRDINVHGQAGKRKMPRLARNMDRWRAWLCRKCVMAAFSSGLAPVRKLL